MPARDHEGGSARRCFACRLRCTSSRCSRLPRSQSQQDDDQIAREHEDAHCGVLLHRLLECAELQRTSLRTLEFTGPTRLLPHALPLAARPRTGRALCPTGAPWRSAGYPARGAVRTRAGPPTRYCTPTGGGVTFGAAPIGCEHEALRVPSNAILCSSATAVPNPRAISLAQGTARSHATIPKSTEPS